MADEDEERLFKKRFSSSPKLSYLYPNEEVLSETYKTNTGLYICDLPPVKIIDVYDDSCQTIDGDTMEKHVAARSISTYPVLANGQYASFISRLNNYVQLVLAFGFTLSKLCVAH